MDLTGVIVSYASAEDMKTIEQLHRENRQSARRAGGSAGEAIEMTEEILEIYRQKARPFLDMCFKPNTCIEQSRVLLEVLRRFSIAVEPMACKLVVTCHARQYQFVSGIDQAELDKAKSITTVVERGALTPDKGLRHVVLLVERKFLVDPTLYQASAPPEFNFVLEPDIAIVPLQERIPDKEVIDLTVEYTGDDGTKFNVRWIGVEDRDWELDDGWEPSHLWPLIDHIENEMRKEIQRRVTEHLMSVCFGEKQ